MRKLDFIVFGVPRSGTTATVKYLNLASNVVCLNELLSHKDDHSKIRIRPFLKDMTGDSSVAEVKQKHARQQLRKVNKLGLDGVLIGNKRPSYFLRLNEVFDELGTDKSVCCVRDLAGVMNSFNSRAKRGENWAEGRTGLFAIAEYIILLKILARNNERNIIVQPQNALASNAVETINAVCEFLLDGKDVSFDQDKLAGFVASGREKSDFKPELEGVEKAFHEKFLDFGLNDLTDAPSPYKAADISQEMLGRVAALPDDPIEFIRPGVEASGFEPTLTYFEKFKKIYGNRI